jgi:hypothetical protein
MSRETKLNKLFTTFDQGFVINTEDWIKARFLFNVARCKVDRVLDDEIK